MTGIYWVSCDLADEQRGYYSAHGTIYEDNQVSVAFFGPFGSKDEKFSYPSKKLSDGKLTLQGAVSDRNLSELLRRRLAKVLHRPENRVRVVAFVMNQLNPSGSGRVAYKYRCDLRRQEAHYGVFGSVRDGVIAFTLYSVEPYPPHKGKDGLVGGSLTGQLLLDRLQLDGPITSERVQALVHKRAARHLRCAPRLLSVGYFGMSRDTSEEEAYTSAAKKAVRKRK